MIPRYFVPSQLPAAVHADSYKFSHPQMYESAREMSAYIEARQSFDREADQRLIHYGTQYFVERYLMRRWTMRDVSDASAFFSTFNAGHTPHPFPQALFERIVTEYDGWFPIKVDALPDGSVIYPRTPQLILTAKGDFSRLVTWMETTALQTIWYMSTVATNSRKIVSNIRSAFDLSTDPEAYWKLGSRFHDFGFRGATSSEQAIMGGAAHLLNSNGTDTSAAAYYVQYHLNGGIPVGSSIPATEHSVMTSFPHEIDAVRKVIREFGSGVFATVADSYDYRAFLNELLPQVVTQVRKLGGFHVVRPDSGDPVACVVDGLRALARAYGSTINQKGFRVIEGAGIIQGDGIDRKMIGTILDAVIDAGFSAENCAFGMGSGLLQRVNRDTLSYACKLSFIADEHGERDILKMPKTDPTKASLPGRFHIAREENILRVYPLENAPIESKNELRTVYDCGPVTENEFDTFETVRTRVDLQWQAIPAFGKALTRQMTDKIHAKTFL